MGSAIGAYVSWRQYKDSNKQLKKAEAKEKSLAMAESAGRAAEAQTMDSDDVVASEKKKRRGLADAFSTASGSTGLGE